MHSDPSPSITRFVAAGCLLSLALSVPAQEKESRKVEAVRAALHSLCDTPPPQHANTIRLAALNLDRALVRDVLAKLAATYGVTLAAAQRVPIGGQDVTLPFADAPRKIAFTSRTSEHASRESGLCPTDAVTSLREQGWSVHHVDLESFRAPQGDSLSPLLAYRGR